jgi:hypothetical protein
VVADAAVVAAPEDAEDAVSELSSEPQAARTSTVRASSAARRSGRERVMREISRERGRMGVIRTRQGG